MCPYKGNKNEFFVLAFVLMFFSIFSDYVIIICVL